MTLLAEADKILQKDNLSIKDYNRFVEIGKKLADTEYEYIYGWLAEGFYLINFYFFYFFSLFFYVFDDVS